VTQKTILITGCSSGIGYYTAKLLAREGHIVYAGVRKQVDLNVFSRLPLRHQPTTFLLDVTWDQQRINKTINKLSPHVDVLINNAGFGFLGAVETISVEQLQSQLDTNLLGLFKVTKSVLPTMRQRCSGLIINVSSISGLVAFAGYGIYSASKFAVEALTQALRLEEARFNISVASLNPGSFETNFWKNEQFPKKSNASPLTEFNQRIQRSVKRSRSYRGSPQIIAKKISQLINSHHQPLNNLVGLDARIIYLLRRLLPQFVFGHIMKRLHQRLI